MLCCWEVLLLGCLFTGAREDDCVKALDRISMGLAQGLEIFSFYERLTHVLAYEVSRAVSVATSGMFRCATPSILLLVLQRARFMVEAVVSGLHLKRDEENASSDDSETEPLLLAWRHSKRTCYPHQGAPQSMMESSLVCASVPLRRLRGLRSPTRC